MAPAALPIAALGCGAWEQLREDGAAEPHCPTGPFAGGDGVGSARRLAVVLRGESFRSGAGNRDRKIVATDEAWDNQRVASESHVTEVIRPFEKCGHQVHAFLATYQPVPTAGKPQPARDLLGWYGRWLRGQTFEDHAASIALGHPEAQMRLHSRALDLVAAHYEETAERYDAILIIRLDMVFKQPMAFLPRVKWRRVLWSFHLLERMAHKNFVADQIQWLPWRFANCFWNCGFEVSPMPCIHRSAHGHIDVLLDERHDTDTYKDRNPLFRLVRQEQRLEVHGGFALLVASIGTLLRRRNFTASAESFSKQLRPQGEPPTYVDIYAHTWTPHFCNYVRDRLGVKEPSDVKCASPRDLAVEHLDRRCSGGWTHVWHAWQGWVHSLREAVRLMIAKESRLGFENDGVAALRSDVVLRRSYQISEYNTSRALFFALEGNVAVHVVPSLIIASSRAMRRLAAQEAMDSWVVGCPPTTVDAGYVTKWLSWSSGLPAVLI
mmetsp:Transcript_43104/g.119219  ORF Transcript_43104/g.119219 Transcript_43104/m.119219 type:complete len:494 (-) Transcript_43104:11-1492(-)